MPDDNNSPSCFDALAQEFNKSAQAFATTSDGITMDGLMTKFNILWKHKAETDLDRRQLTEAMFDSVTEILRRCATHSNHDSLNGPNNSAQQLLAFLCTAEQLPYLPDNAGDKLIDLSLDLIRKHEVIKSDYYWKDFTQHKNELVAMAKTVVTYAEKMQTVPKAATACFAAAKTIAPPKRPILTVQEPGV